jgi:hypothetical protein
LVWVINVHGAMFCCVELLASDVIECVRDCI